MKLVKTRDEIAKMRVPGRVVHKIIHTLGNLAKPGVTTGELEDYAVEIFRETGASSPCLGYSPADHPAYPAWTCICVNNEIVHACPGRRVLKDGDIITIDVALELGGFVADSAYTFAVGEISPKAMKLLKITEESMFKGIAQSKPGRTFNDIGTAVQRHAEVNGFSVDRKSVV